MLVWALKNVLMKDNCYMVQKYITYINRNKVKLLKYMLVLSRYDMHDD